VNRDHYIAQRRASAAASPKNARVQWRVLLDAAVDVAAAAQGRAVPDARAARRGSAAERLIDFRHLLGEGRRIVFPIEGATPGFMVEGFLKVARAFVDAATPARREIYAPALEACARALDGLIQEALESSAEGWLRQFGGDA
jgi:hypothetical protein